MIRANKDRAAILDRQRETDERRHAEVMRRHDEAMAALADQRRGLEAAVASLETMIERTAPKPAPGAPAE